MAQLPPLQAGWLNYTLVILQIQNRNIDETAVRQAWKGIKKTPAYSPLPLAQKTEAVDHSSANLFCCLTYRTLGL